MDIDDEEIPNLVGVGNTADEAQVGDASTAQLQDLSLVKVPLTIVTGSSFVSLCPSMSY